MKTYRVKELENPQSHTDGFDEFEAATLAAAKSKATQAQMFQGTVLELSRVGNEVVNIVSRKINGIWCDEYPWGDSEPTWKDVDSVSGLCS